MTWLLTVEMTISLWKMTIIDYNFDIVSKISIHFNDSPIKYVSHPDLDYLICAISCYCSFIVGTCNAGHLRMGTHCNLCDVLVSISRPEDLSEFARVLSKGL